MISAQSQKFPIGVESVDNFIKFEIKKGSVKKRKTSKNKSRVFKIALEGRKEWKFFLGELQSFNTFVMLTATFSKH